MFILHQITVIFTILTYSLAVNPTVTTKLGMISGRHRNITFDGKDITISQYLGIPYAEPPVGTLRFQKTVPLGKFKETFDASQYGLPCSQYVTPVSISLMKTPNETSEDCLSLNIYIPSMNNNEKIPVMVFIYGGSFLNGMSSTYDGGILAAYGQVIVVTVNYRVGPFGFLSTGDDVVPGNAGLWDQHFAIKWIRDNIDAFEGDTSRITIFGESAGSASVSFQTLYSGNQGLFQRAIAESGAASAFWAAVKPSVASENVKRFAQRFDCETQDSKTILKCLQSIKNATRLAKVAVESLQFQWTPVADGDFIIQGTLESMKLIPSTQNIFQDYNMIIGTNGFDGHLFLNTIFAFVTSQIKTSPPSIFRSIFRSFLMIQMKPFAEDDTSLNAIVDGALFAYTNAENPDDVNYNLKMVCDFVTDSLFFIPALRDAVNHAYNNTKSETYQYEFNHQFPLKLPGNEWLQGATHAGELPYVFGFPSSMAVVTPEIAKAGQPFSKIVMDYWTNFAKTGNPNNPRTVPVQWNVFDNEKRQYLYFPQTGSPESSHYLNARRADFWTTYLPILSKSDVTSGDCTSASTRPIPIRFFSIFIILLFSCI